jgi:2-desacetyl-2-hydroxyethyl bacteriochlorophyllide A dehydrogenase
MAKGKMKALVWVAPRKIGLQEADKPVPQADEVLIRVRAAGICGSEVEGFLGKSDKRIPPLIMGHEFAGDVEQSGPGLDDSLEGTRVVVEPYLTCGVCDECMQGCENLCPSRALIGVHRAGGFAEYVAVPRKAVCILPEGLDYVGGSLVEPLAVSVRLFHQNQRGLIRWVAIFGAGAQGLLAMQVARTFGADAVISDVNPSRLESAKALGASAVIHAKKEDPVQRIRKITGGKGVDLAVDAAGLSITRQQALASLKKGGTVVCVGLGVDEAQTTLDFLDVVNKELRIVGTYAYTKWEFLQAMDLLARGKIQRDGWVEEIPLEEGPKAFEELARGEARAAKFVLIP